MCCLRFYICSFYAFLFLYLFSHTECLFTVENKKNSLWKQILLFCSAFGVAYTAQFLFLILLVEGLDVNEYLAQFLGLFIYGGANFLANKKITFQ